MPTLELPPVPPRRDRRNIDSVRTADIPIDRGIAAARAAVSDRAAARTAGGGDRRVMGARGGIDVDRIRHRRRIRQARCAAAAIAVDRVLRLKMPEVVSL